MSRRRAGAPRSLGRSHHGGRLGVDVPGGRFGEEVLVEVDVDTFASVRAGEGQRPEGGGDQAALEDVGLDEALDTLALLGHPAVEVNQCLNLIVAGRRVADDRPAVWMPD